MRLTLLLVALAAAGRAQVQPANPGFESGEAGQVPSGWFVPPVAAQAGFTATIVDKGCHAGARCALLSGAPANAPGNLMQTLSAAGYVSRRIRLRSAIRVEGSGTRAQMWLRLDREDGTFASLDNMQDRPAFSADWRNYDIQADVPPDVTRLAFGVMLFGSGRAWVDDVSLAVLDEIRKDLREPARPLSERGLANLAAFARLYGFVRFFHPSDQAERTDWDSFAIDGARTVENAASDAELAARLEKLFQPVAPLVQVFLSASRPEAPPLHPGPQVVRYRHNGVGLSANVTSFSAYRSQRVKKDAGDEKLPPVFEAEVAPGVAARVPLAVHADSDGTLPHKPLPPAVPLYFRSAEDRGTRLAAVVILWNVMQHFYPYFDAVKTDWTAELPKALRAAAADPGADAFHKTLQRMVAALKDGHGRVGSPRAVAFLAPPVTLDWVERQLVVTRARGVPGVAPGDRVAAIDARPVDKAAAEARELISGATEQWIRYRLASDLSRCNPETKRMALELEPFASPGSRKTVELSCVEPRFRDMEAYTEPRPEKFAELEPGIFYVDLDRAGEEDWKAAVPRLEKAKGIIFDMRGYPGRPGILALAHLTDTTIQCARWNIPEVSMPDRLDFRFNESRWDVKPETPRFKARIAFLTDGRAISYAETVMGIVEHYKLGEIVGEPTAGTNGNVNPFKLPGGFTVSWTGMKVLKHDRSQHHGIGILPTVPVSRTRKGVAGGKDEILDRALQVVKSPAPAR